MLSHLNNRFKEGFANVVVFRVFGYQFCNMNDIVLDSTSRLCSDNQSVGLQTDPAKREKYTDSAINNNCLRILVSRGSSYRRLCGRRSNSSSSRYCQKQLGFQQMDLCVHEFEFDSLVLTSVSPLASSTTTSMTMMSTVVIGHS